METEALIKALSGDAARRSWNLTAAWWAALASAVVLAAIVFSVTLGPRPDLAAAAETIRVLFKFAFALAVSVMAFVLVRALSIPGSGLWQHARWLFAVPLMLGLASILELAVVPRSLWLARLTGSNSLYCLTFIPLIGAVPLVLFLAALRHGAPTRPRLAGAAAGLLAGGIAAAFYASHCPDDSPLFVAVWYVAGMSILALVGSTLAPFTARW